MEIIDTYSFIVSFGILVFLMYITTPTYKVIFKYNVLEEDSEHIRSESIECPDSF